MRTHSVLSFTICIYGTLNLIREVGRGYSWGRCILPAVILLLAVALSMWTGLGLAGLIMDESGRAAKDWTDPENAKIKARSTFGFASTGD